MEIFEKRKAESELRITKLRDRLREKLHGSCSEELKPTLNIYATGSLARREATLNSDLDAFFMLSGREDEDPIGRIRDVKIFNAVLDAADEFHFPDFSNDGEYLRFIHIEDVVKHIGGREDDYRNNFTARMLMLLESEWLFNECEFNECKGKIINAYFTDFHDHSSQFRPIFLINDVLRFWRTLCLNYENARNWRGGDDDEARSKGHLGNLKLKFSRLTICFSFICHLMMQGKHLTKDHAFATAALSPLDRLFEIEQSGLVAQSNVRDMLAEYAWFLHATGRPKSETLEWIAREDERDEAFSHANLYIRQFGDVVRSVAEENGYLRYLIV